MSVYLHLFVCVCLSLCPSVDTQLAEHSYQYLTTGEDLKGLQEESPTRHKVRLTLHTYQT